MAGNSQPLDQQFAIVDEQGRPTLYFIQWAQQRQIDITNGITLGDLENFLADHRLTAGSGIGLAPDGDIASSPTITAKVQEILDQLSGTQGVVLYRGAAGWAALAPSTAGFVLSTNGAGADPSWIAAAGGGGGAIQQTAKFWRLRALYDNVPVGNNFVSIGEVKFEDAGGTVLTSGGTAISGGYFNATFAPSTAFDGILPVGDSGWISPDQTAIIVSGTTGYTKPGVWLGYNNPINMAPTKVVLYPHANFPNAFIRQFSVDFSLDSGMTWYSIVRCAAAAPVVGTPQTFAIPTFAIP